MKEMVQQGQYRSLGVNGSRLLYSPSLMIDEGGSSFVYLGIKEDDGSEVAVKLMKAGVQTQGDLEKEEKCKQLFLNEIQVLKGRNSLPGIVHYFGMLKLAKKEKERLLISSY